MVGKHGRMKFLVVCFLHQLLGNFPQLLLLIASCHGANTPSVGWRNYMLHLSTAIVQIGPKIVAPLESRLFTSVY